MTHRFSNADPVHRPHDLRSIIRWALTDRLSGRRRPRPPGPTAPRVAPDRDLSRAVIRRLADN